MTPPVWLDIEEVLAIHERQICEFGGSLGLRDRGLLESALDRPRNLANYGHPSLPDLAAAYAFGLAKNHPFIDGNKRVAFVAAYVFLRLTGLRLVASEAEATEIMLAVAASKLPEIQLAAWFTENLKTAIP